MMKEKRKEKRNWHENTRVWVFNINRLENNTSLSKIKTQIRKQWMGQNTQGYPKMKIQIRKQLISQKIRKLTQNQDQNPQVKIEIKTGPICLVTEVDDWPEGGQARASYGFLSGSY